jgi:Trk-type K+ transport system membrane component
MNVLTECLTVPGVVWETIRNFWANRKLHYFILFQTVYTTVVVLFLAGILFAIEPTITKFVDALFIVASAFSCTGLVTVDVAAFQPGGLFICMLSMLFGCLSVLSITAPTIRLIFYWYKKSHQIDHIVIDEHTAINSRREIPNTEEARSQIAEYRALKYIIVLVLSYFILLVMVGGTILSCWSIGKEPLGDLNPGSFGFFHAFSAFNNAGLSTMPGNGSMVPWVNSVLPLMIIASLAILGNTMFPVFFRLYVLSIQAGVNRWGSEQMKETFQFIVNHPRRITIHLFDKWTTLFLFMINSSITLFGIAWYYIALDPDDIGYVADPLLRFVNAFFSSVMTRTTGFNSLDIGKLPPALLVVYAGMMYFASSPVYVTIQRTDTEGVSKDVSGTQVEEVNLFRHFRRILEQHAILLSLAFILIVTFESEAFEHDSNYTVFGIMFEVISGYGTVGLSMGYPGMATSFCGVWSNPSKVILTAVMLMGRLRGLPRSIDTAIVVKDGEAITEVRAL